MNNTATSERSISITILLTLLMIFLGISAATGSLNETESTDLSEQNVIHNTILPLSQLNKPGSLEGSIFTDTTLSSGDMHTCAILDNGAVSCWGRGVNGQLGNGGTSHRNSPTLTSSLGTGRTAVAISSEMPTPVQSSTTVLCRAGDTEVTEDWVMEEHPINILPRLRVALAMVARQLRSLPEAPTPAPYSTTGTCHAGEAARPADWVWRNIQQNHAHTYQPWFGPHSRGNLFRN